MHPQTRYLTALAAQNAAHTAVQADLAPYQELLETVTGIDIYIELELDAETRHCYRQRWQERLEAELDLLAWLFIQMSEQAENDGEQVGLCYLVTRGIRLPSIRRRLVALALVI